MSIASILSEILRLLCFISLVLTVSGFKIVHHNGSYYLYHPHRGTASKVPDAESLKALVHDLSTVPTVSRGFMTRVSLLNNSLPSLKQNSATRDEVMRIEVLKILSVAPPTFWKDTFYLGNMLNPALEHWQGRTFFTWRKGMYDSPINYAWFNQQWLSVGGKVIKPSASAFLQSIINITIAEHTFNHLQEDPRLLARHDGSLTIVYSAKESLFKPPKQCYCHLTLDSKNQVLVSDSVLLDGHSLDPNQKNWIPFEHSEELYFIQTVNPLHILRHTTTDDQRVGQLTTVHHARTEIHLPWMKEYGPQIRGGTPAVLVNGYYLAFFHTVGQLQPKNTLRTYFMGAITFCPTPPFSIHAISTHPILQENFYEGPWVEPRRTDYVMFAIGLLKEDDKHILISFGHQDKHAYLARFHIQELYESMEMVSNCTKSVVR
jgi:predicted GH43/DUF377 family glycosyl hydrolase